MSESKAEGTNVTRLDTWRQRDKGGEGQRQPRTLEPREVDALGRPKKAGNGDWNVFEDPHAKRGGAGTAVQTGNVVRGHFADSVQPDAETPRILLLEPEILIRDQLKEALKKQGYKVAAPDVALPRSYQIPGVTEISAEGKAYDLVIYGDVAGSSNMDGNPRRHDRLLNNRFRIPVIMLTDDSSMQSQICGRPRNQRPQLLSMERHLFNTPEGGEWASHSISAIVEIAQGMAKKELGRGQGR